MIVNPVAPAPGDKKSRRGAAFSGFLMDALEAALIAAPT
jgi:hypothetical protein